MAEHLSRAELEAQLDGIRDAPQHGVVTMIVQRIAVGERRVVDEGEIDLHAGLVGDNWRARGNRKQPDGVADPEAQLTVMGQRAIAAVTPDAQRWPLAGDQLIVDLDLSEAHLPAGTQLSVGEAVLEVSAKPHTGCGKYVERFGLDAMKFVNSPVGRALRLRGLNARVIRPGRVRVGDPIHRIE